MSQETFDASKATGKHLQLRQLEGHWTGTTRTWFEPGQLADESPMRGTLRAVVGGRFLLHEYQGNLNGKPLEGMTLYGFHLGSGKFQCAWVDTFHMGTGMMFSEGESTTKGFSVLGHYGTIEYGETWGWRTEVELINPDQLVITSYNISPAGEEAKATETVYYRQKE